MQKEYDKFFEGKMKELEEAENQTVYRESWVDVPYCPDTDKRIKF